MNKEDHAERELRVLAQGECESADFAMTRIARRAVILEHINEHQECALQAYKESMASMARAVLAMDKAADGYRSLIALCLAMFLLLLQPAWATNAAGTPQQVEIGVQVVQGISATFPNTLFQYVEPTTTTCQYAFSTQISIPASTTNFAINTATLFPALVAPALVGVAEITNPPVNVNIGLDSSGQTLNLNPQGFVVARVTSGLPTFYVTNPSSTQAALLQVFCLGN